MTAFKQILLAAVGCSGLWLVFTYGALSADPQSGQNAEANVQPHSVDEARRQAALLHETYLATLLVVHREYFDEDERDTLPARAFEEVFRKIDERTNGSTRWISVNSPAMNIDHEPKTEFENAAALALAGGKTEFERLEDGRYHRAAPVRFLASCSKCHLSGLGSRRSGKMAALVISLPLPETKTTSPKTSSR